VESVRRVSELTGDLQPSTFTLHLELDEDLSNADSVKMWLDRVRDALIRVLSSGPPARMFSVENLIYPMEIVDDVIRDLGMSICLDVGHLTLIGGDVRDAFDRYEDIISIIHLYGIGCRGEHLSLTELPEEPAMEMIRSMREFSGTVSPEVFSYENLVTSLDHFEKIWHRWGAVGNSEIEK